MKLQFSNKALYYICAVAFQQMPFLLQVQICNKVQAHDADDYTQEIDVTASELVSVFAAISNEREGVAAVPNNQLEEVLLPQLLQGLGLTGAQMQAFAQTKALPVGYTTANETQAEYTEVLQGIMAIKKANAAQRERMYASGKAIFIPAVTA